MQGIARVNRAMVVSHTTPKPMGSPRTLIDRKDGKIELQ